MTVQLGSMQSVPPEISDFLAEISAWGAGKMRPEGTKIVGIGVPAAEHIFAQQTLALLSHTAPGPDQERLLVLVLRRFTTAFLERLGVGDDWAVPPSGIEELKNDQDDF